MPVEKQACVLYAGVRGYLDKLVTSEIKKFEEMYLDMLDTKHSHILTTIRDENTINEKIDAELKAILEDFIPNSGLKMKG